MKPITTITIAAALFTAASGAAAAQPTTFEFVADVVLGEEVYSHYVVHCSNGSKYDLSAWNNRQLWCTGVGSKNKCNKTQLSIGRYLCKATG